MSSFGKIIRVNSLPPEEEREVNVIYQVAAPGENIYTDYAIDENGEIKVHSSATKNYKSYVAKLEVDPSLNLVTKVLYNDLGPIVWSQENSETYKGVLTGGEFTQDKTIVLTNLSFSPTVKIAHTPAYNFPSNNEILLYLTGGIEVHWGMIEIRIYH